MSRARELSELPNGVDVDANGNVGIGTNTPSGYNSKLAVLGNIAMANTQSRFYPYYISSTNHAYVSSTAGGDLTFGTGLSGVSERMRIDTAGRVTTPNQPSGLAYMTGDQGIGGDVWTKVNLNTALFNVGSMFNTSNGRFTAPVSGKYFVSHTVQFSSPSGSYLYTGIQVNGAFYFYGQGRRTEAGWLGDNTLGNGQLVHLNAGDYVDLWAYSTSSNTLMGGTQRASLALHLLG